MDSALAGSWTSSDMGPSPIQSGPAGMPAPPGISLLRVPSARRRATPRVRGGIRARPCSWAAWAPAPLAPRGRRGWGRPIAAVKLPSDPPPGRTFGQVQADRRRPMTRARSKRSAMAGVRSIGGRLKPPSTISCLAPRRRCRGSPGGSRPRSRPGLVGGGDADVDLRRGPGGDDVRGAPALDQADVHGGAELGLAQGVEIEDLVGELADGADALLGLDAGVGRPAPRRSG